MKYFNDISEKIISYCLENKFIKMDKPNSFQLTKKGLAFIERQSKKSGKRQDKDALECHYCNGPVISFMQDYLSDPDSFYW